jgi:N-formylglutamate amidohydrolase
MFDGRLPSFANTRSMRVAGGLGTIPRVVGDAQEIYASAFRRRRAGADRGALQALSPRAAAADQQGASGDFGAVVLVDCHSMPSIGVSRDEPRRPDVVIGDRYGTSCAALLADTGRADHARARLFGRRNKPYAGGFITEHYGNPAAACMPSSSRSTARSIWTSRRERVTGFGRLAADLETLARRLGEIPLEELRPYRALPRNTDSDVKNGRRNYRYDGHRFHQLRRPTRQRVGRDYPAVFPHLAGNRQQEAGRLRPRHRR